MLHNVSWRKFSTIVRSKYRGLKICYTTTQQENYIETPTKQLLIQQIYKLKEVTPSCVIFIRNLIHSVYHDII